MDYNKTIFNLRIAQGIHTIRFTVNAPYAENRAQLKINLEHSGLDTFTKDQCNELCDALNIAIAPALEKFELKYRQQAGLSTTGKECSLSNP